MIGIELRMRAMPIVKDLARRGVQVLIAGPTVLRLLPPLVITREELDEVAVAIRDALRSQELS
jgi:acetylornithine/succinyldiaminopimelate/putrescine aminotransferase